MHDLKRIAPEAIPAALDQAERYRLLNEPEAAESICHDVLAVEPDNQRALIMLLLSLTDQFRGGPAECFRHAEEVLPRLQGEYERLYYAGLVWERRALARLHEGEPGCGRVAHPWLERAMDFYTRAEAVRPHNNDDAILRWNTCARIITRHRLGPETAEVFEPALDD
jgi:hypothetical protein